jgi:hypothetical protein
MGHPPFVFSTVILGGLGFWITVLCFLLNFEDKHTPLVNAIGTYFPAVAFTAAYDMTICQESKKYVRSFSIACLILVLVLSVMCFLPFPGYSHCIFSLCGTALAWFLWWISNSKNPTYHDITDAQCAIGGDLSQPIGGSAEDFTTGLEK